jgi:hypothetical protein
MARLKASEEPALLDGEEANNKSKVQRLDTMDRREEFFMEVVVLSCLLVSCCLYVGVSSCCAVWCCPVLSSAV